VRYRLLDAVTKMMAALVARSASRIFVATPAWETRLRRYISDDQPVTWLPVPSTIPVASDHEQIAAAQRQYISAVGPVIGHFGTHPPAITSILRGILPRLLAEHPTSTVILIGANSDKFQKSLVRECPDLVNRVIATGALPAAEVSVAIAICDLMVQPYPDGVTSRRTTMMAALDHARAIVTTHGSLTEPLWRQRGAVFLVQTGKTDNFVLATSELIRDEDRRRRYGITAKALYEDSFHLRHTIRALQYAYDSDGYQ
jgi:glycosyltransferase involved in cell wall biosynthesis